MKHLFKLILAFALFLGGCLPQNGADSALDHVVSSGNIVLLALDSIEAARLSAIEHPTEQDITEARERVTRLRTIRDTLQAVADSGDLRGNQAKLALAVKLLRLATDQAKAERAPVPPEVEQALVMTETWLASQGADDG